MKKLFLLLVSFLFTASCSNCQDIEKIKELQSLGFTNEQIVEMMSKNQPAQQNQSQQEIETAQANEELMKQLADRMEKAKAQKQGLVVFFASKEDTEKGPGYLNAAATKDNNKTQLGQIPILEYSLEGQKGAAVTTAVTNTYRVGHKYSFDVTNGVSYIPDIITSRYIGEFMLDEGTYEMELSRRFITSTDPFGGHGKATRHKLFHKVEVEAGKVTLVSYFWKLNLEFGLDDVMSQNHKIVENNLVNKFGPYLKYIKIQHNK